MTDKMNKILYPRGSEWRKWDLHVHCPEDVLNNQFKGKNGNEKWEEYINRLENLDIEVIGLTNYFCIDGYEKIVELQNKSKLKKIKLILPNIEFRLSELNKDKEFINFHIIFSDKVSVKKIKSFLNRLYLLNTNKEGKRLPCSEENLKIVRYDKALIGFDIFDEIIKDFTPLKDYLIFGVIRGYGSFRPDKNNGGRKESLAIELDKRSHAIFGNENNVEFFLREDRYEGAIKKPVVLSTDAHDLDAIGTKFSWIKANPTFEGLKQIIYEPEERVYLGEKNPNKFDYPIILRTKINNCSKSFFFEKELEVDLNPHLVTIIGSRGSGKSAFLDTIVLPLGRNEVLDRDNYIKDYVNKRQTLDIQIAVQSSSDGNEKLLSFKNLISGEFIKEFSFEYYSQKEIGHLADPKSKTDLSKLIFQKIFERRAEEEIKLIRKYIDDALSKLGENREQIQKIERDLKDEKGLKEKLEENKKQIGFLQDPQIKYLVEKREKFIQIKTQYKEIKEKINDEVKTIKKSVEILQPTHLDYIFVKTKENESFLPKEWIQFEKSDLPQLIKDILDGKEKLFDSLTTIINKIEEHDKYFDQKEIKNINDEIRKVVKEKNISYSDKGVEDLQKKIATVETQLKKIEELKKKKQELIKERGEIRKAYFTNLGTIKDKLENVFAAFCNEEGKILNERVKIDFSLNIKKEECIDIIEKDHALDSSFCGNFPREILLRIIGERGIDEVIGALRKGSFDSWQVWENIGPRTVEYLNNIINKEEVAMRLEEILPALSFGLKWRVAQNYKPLTECSIGERSTAVLSVILVSGTIPLIIDQPEDDLDHSYIFKPLTDIIKHVKKKRQLIFITHNANIVINGDAEQILIMETEDGKHGNITISTIEDIERRNKLLSILEGGKEAFENREKKYDFK